MKTYRVTRPYLWMLGGTKILLTGLGAVLYVSALANHAPLPARLALLAGLTTMGYVLYVRLPKMPTEINVAEDGAVDFRGRRGVVTRLRAQDIKAVRRTFLPIGRGAVKIAHSGGKVRLVNRFGGFYDFLTTLKSHNPAIQIKGF